MHNDQVILVDANDVPLGVAEKWEAHKKALLHRAFSVFVYRLNNGSYELLLQQRQFTKYHSGGLWSNTCCSHPRPDETILLAATRRLQEEMNLKVVLQPVGVFTYKAVVNDELTEHEVDHVLVGFYDNQEIKINNEEIANCRWVTTQALVCDLDDNPHLYTAWLKQALKIANQALPVL